MPVLGEELGGGGTPAGSRWAEEEDGGFDPRQARGVIDNALRDPGRGFDAVRER
ncbi:hypothetical protein [Streptomyces sp. NPDC101150]|uniref:hypothetical protein n=1 Tax=Streptomyces sp. NPDC101150 TaxID=3366114 RepID=UPI0037F19F13